MCYDRNYDCNDRNLYYNLVTIIIYDLKDSDLYYKCVVNYASSSMALA